MTKMVYEEMKKLADTAKSSVVGDRTGWYLLKKVGQTWVEMAGPFGTRVQARDARDVATSRFWGLPFEDRYRNRDLLNTIDG